MLTVIAFIVTLAVLFGVLSAVIQLGLWVIVTILRMLLFPIAIIVVVCGAFVQLVGGASQGAASDAER